MCIRGHEFDFAAEAFNFSGQSWHTGLLSSSNNQLTVAPNQSQLLAVAGVY